VDRAIEDEDPDEDEPVNRTCSNFEGRLCGGVMDYGQILSLCCNIWGSDEGKPRGILVCDKSGVGLTFTQCGGEFSCIQRLGFYSKRSGMMGPYAQCEKTDS
jgi:hypothetical protein